MGDGEWGYERPASLTGLSASLSGSGEVLVIGGGTDIVPAVKRGTVHPATLVSTLRVPEFGEIREEDESVGVGSAVSLDTLARSHLARERYPALVQAASTLASRQIRNRGTVGGNLCLETRCDYYNKSAFWRKEYPGCRKAGGDSCYVVPRGTGCHALHSGDLAPAFMAYRAQAEVLSTGGEKTLFPLEDLYSDSGLHSTVLEPREVLVRALLPPSDHTRAVFLRWAPRETIDFPSVTVAAAVGPEWSRLIVGHVLPRPVRVVAAEGPVRRLVSGEDARGEDDSAEVRVEEIAQTVVDSLDMKSAHRGAVWHKKNVIRTLVRRALYALRADEGERRIKEGGA